MNDQELIHQAIQGDTSAFEQLVFRYRSPLIRFLRFKCQNEADVADVFQETFLNAHLYLRSYDEQYAFSTWLFSIALKQLSKKVQRTMDADPMCTVDDPYLSQSESTASDSRSAFSRHFWLQLSRHLTSEQMDLLWFFYVEELTGQEVADVLERSLPWVKMNLRRVKVKLNECFSKNGQPNSEEVLSLNETPNYPSESMVTHERNAISSTPQRNRRSKNKVTSYE